MYLMSFVVGYSADKLINANIMSTSKVRKLFNSISHYGGAAALIMLAFSNCDRVMAITALCLATGFNSGIYVGYCVSTGYIEQIVHNSETDANVCNFS